MINSNKILTVSYGTFSCTLEGFDDSFGTMKAIAEYFRDLSADDRYFGAEPVQPDAQMLARIAEREISRQVEAREDEGRIVLSAKADDPAPVALTAQADEPDTAEDVSDTDDSPADESEPPKAPAEEGTAQEEAPEAEAPTRVMPKKKVVVKRSAPAVAATQRAEKVVPDSTADEAPAQKPSVVEAAASETATAQSAQDEQPVQDEAAERVIVPSLPDEEVEAFFADGKVATAEQAPEQDEPQEDLPAAQDRAKADSIADKLKRIRAVVSQQGDANEEPFYSEDQHAIATVAPAEKIAAAIADEDDTTEDDSSDAVLETTLRDLEEALDTDDEAEAASADADEFVADDALESEDDDITAILNRLESDAETEAHEEDEFGDEDFDADEFEDEFDDETDDEDDIMGGNILAAMDTVEAATDETDLADENLFEEAQDTPEEIAADPEPAPETPAPARVVPRTRVLKVKRATLEAAIQSGQLEEYDEDETEAAPAAPLRKAPLAERSSLSDEAEDALARELAELEADMEAGTSEDYEEEIAQAAPETAPETITDTIEDTPEDDLEDDLTEDSKADKASRARAYGFADGDFSRLMEESEQQMGEPEAATRRDAFAHLRAAVAAKKADEAVGGDNADADTDEAYRDDLASVVRPRRPASAERARTQRPAEPRPAPLKLVAEQRIDTAEPKQVTPVRPRRVAAVAPQPAPQPAGAAQDFAEFATEMGATKLPDLLEAAAAYLSFVEGHEQFSRPQLMTKVRQVEKEDFTREDSLRSFGQLLREGKIEKMQGGRFQASDQIGFRPAKRAAG